MSRIKHNLGADGFCFLPKIFSSDQVECARNALWDVIQGQYETGVQPENRFWNVGDDPKSIIKIDKPHLCNEQIWSLITDVDFGKWLADAVGAKKNPGMAFAVSLETCRRRTKRQRRVAPRYSILALLETKWCIHRLDCAFGCY